MAVGLASTYWLPIELYTLIPIVLTFIFLLTFIFGEKQAAYKKEWSGKKEDSKADFLQTFLILPLASKIAEIIVPIALFYPIEKISTHLAFN